MENTELTNVETIENTGTNGKRKRAPAKNTVILMRGTPGERVIVREFAPNSVVKSPKRALMAYLKTIKDNPDHELHEALHNDELSVSNATISPIVMQVVETEVPTF